MLNKYYNILMKYIYCEIAIYIQLSFFIEFYLNHFNDEYIRIEKKLKNQLLRLIYLSK